MKALVLAAALSSFSLSPVLASEEGGKTETPGEAARAGIEALMRALEIMMDSIPTYELPELLPNGDIIIRRVPSDGEDDDDQGEDGDDEAIEETRT